MTDLPKRGDRVRVTEVLTASFLQVGGEITLTEDARPCPNWGEGACECIYEGRNGNGWGRTYTGAVKVEILERATTDVECPTCRGYKERATDMRDCATCKGNGRVVAPVESDYTRGRRDGMRRVLELAKVHVRWDPESAVLGPDFTELEAAVEDELKNG